MANTNFIDSQTPVVASWLNDVNDLVYEGTIPPGTTFPSSSVTYTPSGTGAVATTVQSKLRETVSVKDFGAVGDGIADDTAAIQTAVNYVNSLDNGGTVFFPTGNYKVTSTITLFSDKTGLLGNAAVITLTGNTSESYVLFNITHSSNTVFPAFQTIAINGLTIVSANNLKGIAFSVAGLGNDKFASQIHFQQLNIQNFYATWVYGDYAFTPMITECAVSGCVQVFRQDGTISTGAHFVFDKCLFTEIGQASPAQVAFYLGNSQTYKFIACDIEVSHYTCMQTDGSDVYLSNCHMELDVGLAGAPLFIVNNTDYGQFVFEQNTMFIWQTTASTVPFWQAKGTNSPGRMSSFSFINNRIIQNYGVSGNATMYANYLLPFLGNGSMTFRSPMQPLSGQNGILCSMGNNSLSNWNFSNAYTDDFTQGGTGTAVSTTADVPYGTANCVVIPANRYIYTDYIPIQENAQLVMFGCWAKKTSGAGTATAEFRFYNAKKTLVRTFSLSITPSTTNTWELFVLGPTDDKIQTEYAKYMTLSLVSDGSINNQVAYPYVDFA